MDEAGGNYVLLENGVDGEVLMVGLGLDLNCVFIIYSRLE
jgi:hypothetical protein